MGGESCHLSSAVLCWGNVGQMQVWEGNNNFYCNGRLISGPGPQNVLASTALIFVPVSLFLLRVGHFLAENEPWTRWIARPAVAMLCFVSLASLLRAHCMDPGIIPRASTPAPNPRNSSICRTCQVVKPPRSHHCRVCNNCVAIFDHHCPWIGNCVAHRNYRHFVAFIMSTWALDIVVLGFTAYFIFFSNTDADEEPIHISSSPASSPAAGHDNYQSPAATDSFAGLPEAMMLGIYCIVVLMPIWSLCGYHLYLISQGETTKERIMAKRHKIAQQEAAEPAPHGLESRQALANANDMHCVSHWWGVCGSTPSSMLGNLTAYAVSVDRSPPGTSVEQDALPQMTGDGQLRVGSSNAEASTDKDFNQSRATNNTHVEVPNILSHGSLDGADEELGVPV